VSGGIEAVGAGLEHRPLAADALRVPVLGFGTATFGGSPPFFEAWGRTDAAGARRMVDLCLDHGVTLFDTANSYSHGLAERHLGAALRGRRDRALVATKAGAPIGPGRGDGGTSRHHLLTACEDSLRRLDTDHIDIYYLHEFDATTPIEETLGALGELVTSGKVRSVACSNFSGWHLMKSLATAERLGLPRHAAHQVSYSLVNREYEWELMPLAADQDVPAVVWSPLAGGALAGKARRGEPLPTGSRIACQGMPAPASTVHAIVDVLTDIASEAGRTVAQVALNWLLGRPTVSCVLIGARDEQQLRENLGAVGWNLSAEQIARLDAVSAREPVYPYAHQRLYPELNPPLVRW
jgi:aryl-alcohol dehydrogenase-like predicted oxidoreductase